jgi:hypothetical protein
MENITGIEISSVLDGMKVNNSDRETMSVMLHDVVFDNQKAIYDLVNLGHIGPASALLRVLFEAHVKGIWLYSCATDEQISQFKKDSIKSAINPKWELKFYEMIDAIEAKNPNLNGSLRRFKEAHWKGLNSLTHSGVMQFSYDFAGGEMRRKYSSDLPNTLLNFSERFAISSLGSVGKIVGSVDIIKCSINLSSERLGITI